MSAYPEYFKPCPFDSIDVYRVLQLFEVNDPCIQHAVKKLLVAGARGGGKDQQRDIGEAIASLQRWQAMRHEEGAAAGAEVERGPLPPQPFGCRHCGMAYKPVADQPHVWMAECDCFEILRRQESQRAAYRERWKDAPAWARWRVKEPSGRVSWYGASWVPAVSTFLEGVSVEPRPDAT